ncbi:MAG: NADH-quinone oxidoreductase subunit L [Anaerolineaceae bacterium 4572_78]|nr:MAG: NADH-quinone oxidoreductase subunit L [Anaerolineaceae bacterium 4572_78]
MVEYVWLTIAFPLIGVLINLFFGRLLEDAFSKWFKRSEVTGFIGSVTVVLSFLVSFAIFLQALGIEHFSHQVKLWDWITIGDFHVAISFLVDPLSIIMLLVVTGVGSLIHIYAVGYMDHDEGSARFFTYLNLFVASMLVLVLSDNYAGLYVGWELVGVCSYLLIGFWFFKPSAADAGKKAFIVNRIGDFGFALGIFLIWSTFGTLDYMEVFHEVGASHGEFASVINWVTILLFVGAIGKSAQIPLYVWLPDAMEGPTPVSALIHAATMVTAGVYMIARNNVLFAMAPNVSLVIAFVGAITAFFAATMALVAFDLKRVLAYSTISQLGYMILAVGVGAYAAGIFHLFTHAFFKALLFMAAGSVMHAMKGVIDMRRLGGLKDKMPETYWTFLIGAAALSGFPLITAGFWSKDNILVKAFELQQPNQAFGIILYTIGIITALLTAFYTFRAVFMTFHGEPRDKNLYDHAHENRRVMTLPLWILAIFSIGAGFLGLPSKLGLPNWIEDGWLYSVMAESHEILEHAHHFAHIGFGLEIALLSISAVVALVGIFGAWHVYIRYPQIAVDTARYAGRFYQLVLDKYRVDELYDTWIIEPGKGLADILAKIVDMNFIDKTLVDGSANSVRGLGHIMAILQTGYIRNYVMVIFVGIVVMGVYFFLL